MLTLDFILRQHLVYMVEKGENGFKWIEKSFKQVGSKNISENVVIETTSACFKLVAGF